MDARQKLTFFEKIKSKFNIGGSAMHKLDGSLDHISKANRSSDCRVPNQVKILDKRIEVKDWEFKPR